MPRPPEKTELVKFACRCGKEWTQRVRHYDIIMCTCGGFVWALQPRRDGPLEGFIWLGDKSTLRIHAPVS